ncbi:MAG TPA: efflux RND transporter periplasmic adaptor subunit [Gemmatimonadales bacterium]|nr:efflux RND transporter periplasmic adaptor subunit [Gemmatimonadales bacterium]
MKHLCALALVSLLAACNRASSKGAAGGGPPPMPVEVAVARRDTVVDAIRATGQIEAIQSVDLRAEVEGRVVEILVREGQEVADSTPLFRLDDAELKAQVARAEAERDLARRALERTKQLIAQNASSAADLERAEATARSTEAALELFQIRLERTIVRAPFAGVVGRRYVSVGEYANNNTRLVSLQSVTPQYAVFQVPERYADQLRRGQPVAFRVAALPEREFSGDVVFVDPTVELPARTILMKALVPNPRRALAPGMFIEARLATAVRPNSVVVPEDAILPLQGATFVWVVKDGKADRRQVTLGVREAGWAEVRGGVEAGEQVVVGGIERLFPGAPVMAKVIERGAPPAEGTR